VQDPFIYTSDDVPSRPGALVEGRGGAWWDEYFADRARPSPFFVEWPDENLVAWFGEGLLAPGRVLELGCGHGRNATYLASLGCSVDAVDFSARAIEWARERAKQAGTPVDFQCCSIFDAIFTEGSYDLVYDSGCFHHLPPHRR
jgi:2-polyprenyl-3-methyl-5-hydroxy-6-metoxy-1,4-benzoquinol methylase